MPQTIFLVVGHGDMYRRLVWEAAELEIGNRVVFPGFLGGDQLRACYQMADVFVMPSVSEPYGIVALEALASGTPAIISKQSGVAESLSHVLKVDFWDTEKMAEMVVGLLKYPEMAREMAKQARKEAGAMTWQRAAAKTLEVYRQVVG
jgi:glycosyltransferase involved in cell wall biosynthesis